MAGCWLVTENRLIVAVKMRKFHHRINTLVILFSIKPGGGHIQTMLGVGSIWHMLTPKLGHCYYTQPCQGQCKENKDEGNSTITAWCLGPCTSPFKDMNTHEEEEGRAFQQHTSSINRALLYYSDVIKSSVFLDLSV